MRVALLEDEHASLDAALAFLDDCGDFGHALAFLDDLSTHADAPLSGDHELECSSSSSSSCSETASSSSSSSSIRSGVSDALQEREKRSKQRTRNVPTLTKRAHKEIAAELRHDINQLTARLRQLQERRVQIPSQTRRLRATSRLSSPSRLSPARASGRSAAYHVAMMEIRKLSASEAANQELRAAWKKQIALARKLESLIKQIGSLELEPLLVAKSENRDLLVCESSTRHYDPFDATELVHLLEFLYRQTALVSTSISSRDTSRVFSSTHVLDDYARGQTFEFTTNTPLVCALSDLDAHVMWNLHVRKAVKMTCELSRRVESPPAETSYFEYLYTQALECQLGTLEIKGISIARKFDDPHQAVLTYTSKQTLADSELTIHMTGWVIMTEAAANEADPTQRSRRTLLQTCFRIHAESAAASTPASDTPHALDPAVYLKNFVLMTKCDEMRAKILNIQTGALKRFGSSPPPPSART